VNGVAASWRRYRLIRAALVVAVLLHRVGAGRAGLDRAAGDVPVPGQYDGDGKADLAVWHAGSWQILGVGGLVSYPVGTIGDVPATLG
jgi:hypothetical protein